MGQIKFEFRCVLYHSTSILMATWVEVGKVDGQLSENKRTLFLIIGRQVKDVDVKWVNR